MSLLEKTKEELVEMLSVVITLMMSLEIMHESARLFDKDIKDHLVKKCQLKVY